MFDIENSNEEIFCLKFELNALSEVLINGSSERWVPGFSLPHVEKEHLDRYNG